VSPPHSQKLAPERQFVHKGWQSKSQLKIVGHQTALAGLVAIPVMEAVSSRANSTNPNLVRVWLLIQVSSYW